MKYGIIIRNVTDLRALPRFRSERRSQLLFDEPVVVGRKRKGYYEIEQSDGYKGWVDERALHVVESQARFDSLSSGTSWQVVSGVAPVTATVGHQAPPFLFYGTRLKLIRKTGKVGIVETGEGKLIRVSLKDVAVLRSVKRASPEAGAIVKDASRFLGTPYLWGGITPFGFDCSGLVQMVYRVHGIELPRDSGEQMKVGRKIKAENVRRGDLLFFRGHVAIAIDRYRMIHSSLGSGGVAFNSLSPKDGDFRRDLVDIFIEARRVLR